MFKAIRNFLLQFRYPTSFLDEASLKGLCTTVDMMLADIRRMILGKVRSRENLLFSTVCKSILSSSLEMKTFSWCVVKCIFGSTDEEAVELLLLLLEEEINSFPELLRLDKSVIWIASAPGLATDIAILERFWKCEKKSHRIWPQVVGSFQFLDRENKH